MLGIAKVATQKHIVNPPPSFDNASAAETQGMGLCAGEWRVTATWNTTGGNDSLYEAQVFLYPGSGGALVTGLTSGDTSWQEFTGETGSTAETGTMHSRQYTIKLVRISDSFVVDEIDTNTVTAETGAAC